MLGSLQLSVRDWCNCSPITTSLSRYGCSLRAIHSSCYISLLYLPFTYYASFQALGGEQLRSLLFWDIVLCHQAFVAQLYKEEFFIGPRRVNMSMYTLIYANISLYLACSITQCNGACLQLKKYADPRTIAHFIWRPTHHRTLSMKTHAPSDTLHGDPRTIGHFTWRPTHHRTLYMETHAPSDTLHGDLPILLTYALFVQTVIVLCANCSFIFKHLYTEIEFCTLFPDSSTICD